jgi:hypothetical protein
MKRRCYITVLLSTGVASACPAAIEFSGYLKAATGISFVVTDTEARRSSDWIHLGQAFDGYTLVAFDAGKEILWVKKGESKLELPLKRGVVKSAIDSASIARQLDAANQALSAMRVRFKDGHPLVVEQLRKIAELERQLTK